MKSKRFLSRRVKGCIAVALVIAMSAAGMTACGSSSSSSESKNSSASAESTSNSSQKAGSDNKMTIGYLTSTGHLLYFVAKEEGYFDEEGLDVTLKKFNANTDMLSAMESGKLDATAMGTNSTENYISNGHDITVIGGIMSEGHALVVKKDVVKGVDPSDYSDLNLLKGKTIATTKDGIEDMMWRESLKKAGIGVGDGADQVHFKYVDTGDAAYAATKNSGVDGALVYTPFHALAEQDGLVTLQYSGDLPGFKDHPCCRNVALTSEVNANPEKYEKFLRALIKAYKFYRNDEDGTVKDITKYVDVDPDIIKSETYADWISMYPDPDKKAFVNFKDTMVDLGYFDDLDVEKYVNTDIYKKALDSIVKENPDDKDYQELESRYDKYDS